MSLVLLRIDVIFCATWNSGFNTALSTLFGDPKKTHSQFRKHFYNEKWAQSIEHWPLFVEYESKPDKSSPFNRTKTKITSKNLVLQKKNWDFIDSKEMKFVASNTLSCKLHTAQYWLCVFVNLHKKFLWLI